MAGPKQLQNLDVSNRRLNSTNVPLEVVVLDGSGAQITGFGSGGTQYTDGDVDATITGTAILFEDDSTAQTLGVVNSTNPLPVTFTGSISVDTVVTVSTGSVRVHQSSYADLNGLMRIADRDQSTQVANITNTDPASTAWALSVRQVGGTPGSTTMTVRQSTAGDLLATVIPGAASTWGVAQGSTVWAVQVDGRVRAQNSTIGDLLASVQQNSTVWQVQAGGVLRAQNSTIGDLLASVQQNSTVWQVQQGGYVAPSTTIQVSSLGGAVVVRSSAADALGTVYQSTIGDLKASVQQNSTVWQVQAKIQDSSGVGFIGTTTRPSTGVQGLVVRTVLNDLQSTSFSTIGNDSTSSTIVSSVAAIRHKVYAYSITSTVQAVNTLRFASSLANHLWNIQLQAISGGIAGANLAVSPPAWLFATEAASPLVFKVSGTTGTYHLAFSYFSEA